LYAEKKEVAGKTPVVRRLFVHHFFKAGYHPAGDKAAIPVTVSIQPDLP